MSLYWFISTLNPDTTIPIDFSLFWGDYSVNCAGKHFVVLVAYMPALCDFYFQADVGINRIFCPFHLGLLIVYKRELK